MSDHPMIRRIWLSSGIRTALCCCTYWELREVMACCEKFLAMRDYNRKAKEERIELMAWREIVIDEIQRRQLSWFLGHPV